MEQIFILQLGSARKVLLPGRTAVISKMRTVLQHSLTDLFPWQRIRSRPQGSTPEPSAEAVAVQPSQICLAVAAT